MEELSELGSDLVSVIKMDHKATFSYFLLTIYEVELGSNIFIFKKYINSPNRY